MTLTMYVEALAVLSDITRNRHLQMKKAKKKWQRGQSIRVTVGRSKLLMVNKRVKRLIRRLFIWKKKKTEDGRQMDMVTIDEQSS